MQQRNSSYAADKLYLCSRETVFMQQKNCVSLSESEELSESKRES